jgi:hypothetical protein
VIKKLLIVVGVAVALTLGASLPASAVGSQPGCVPTVCW